jgi:hypothetical protein
MTLTVDSNQKKLYTLLQRLLIKLLLSPDSPEQYGTEIGSQLSFSFPQAVSLFSGSGVKPLLSQKTHRRSSMPTADCLRKKEQPSKKSPYFNSNSLLHSPDSSLAKSILSISISISQIEKKETTQKKKEDRGLASLTIERKMRKFFGGAGNPTEAKNYKIPRRRHHA